MAGDFEVHAFIETAEKCRTPFFLRISKPRKGRSKIDYYCLVHLPTILKSDKEIYGTDPEQALTLSKEFAKALLAGQTITDAQGNPVTL